MVPRTLVGLVSMVDGQGQRLNAPSLLSGVRQMATKRPAGQSWQGQGEQLGLGRQLQHDAARHVREPGIGILREAYAKTGEIGSCVTHAPT
ncbi:hypothetical protein [Burkholderia stagnalis]|uniref:hypothetical protein n=1 Tax=Burkholderia stagnalis TaxID=1503054 RepID=UPI0012DA0209|nr:hypothetical protein [Burkholderia stagnalis]